MKRQKDRHLIMGFPNDKVDIVKELQTKDILDFMKNTLKMDVTDFVLNDQHEMSREENCFGEKVIVFETPLFDKFQAWRERKFKVFYAVVLSKNLQEICIVQKMYEDLYLASKDAQYLNKEYSKKKNQRIFCLSKESVTQRWIVFATPVQLSLFGYKVTCISGQGFDIDNDECIDEFQDFYDISLDTVTEQMAYMFDLKDSISNQQIVREIKKSKYSEELAKDLNDNYGKEQWLDDVLKWDEDADYFEKNKKLLKNKINKLEGM